MTLCSQKASAFQTPMFYSAFKTLIFLVKWNRCWGNEDYLRLLMLQLDRFTLVRVDFCSCLNHLRGVRQINTNQRRVNSADISCDCCWCLRDINRLNSPFSYRKVLYRFSTLQFTRSARVN